MTLRQEEGTWALLAEAWPMRLRLCSCGSKFPEFARHSRTCESFDITTSEYLWDALVELGLFGLVWLFVSSVRQALTAVTAALVGSSFKSSQGCQEHHNIQATASPDA